MDREFSFEDDISKPAVIIGNSSVMSHIRTRLEHIAPRDTTVLITGEGGTGKELFARALHRKSARRDHPFLELDCAALNDRGFAYGSPGSDQRDALDDLYEIAQDCTLFFRETSALAPHLQNKLVRFLQRAAFGLAGQPTSYLSRVRVIATSVRDLAQEAREGRFREDLYHRLNIIHIEMPRLREHKEDIPMLSDYFIQRFATKYKRHIIGTSPMAGELLLRYDWPANVGELEQVLERAIIVSEGKYIQPEDLPKNLR